MQKQKLLVWSDFLINTGFGTVAKNLFDELHLFYDVTIVGINCRIVEPYDTTKYFVYPIETDLYNRNKLLQVAQQLQPDKILLFNDIQIISMVIDKLKKVCPNAEIISYFPIDLDNVVSSTIFDASDKLITYTEWAKERLNTTKHVDILPHGVNHYIYTYKTPPNTKFTLLNVNRYQPRKALPLTLKAFYLFAKGYHICECGNKYSTKRTCCDLCGSKVIYNTTQPKSNVEYILHCDPYDGASSVDLYSVGLSVGYEPKDFNNIIKYDMRQLNDEEMCDLYNQCTYNFTLTLGEGFGLSLIEALACGRQTICPDNTVMREVLKDTGIYIPNIMSYYFNDWRPVVDINKIVDILNKLYESRTEMTNACINLAHKEYDWNNIRGKLLNILQQ